MKLERRTTALAIFVIILPFSFVGCTLCRNVILSGFSQANSSAYQSAEQQRQVFEAADAWENPRALSPSESRNFPNP